MPKVEEPNDRVREQIEEILEEDEKRLQPTIRVARPVVPRVAPRKVRAGRTGTPIWYPTPEKLIGLGIGLLVIAVISRRAVLPLTLVGFLIAATGYYLIVRRKRRAKYGYSSGSSGPAPQQYWRGKPVKPSRAEKPGPPVKKRDGNVLEFPDPIRSKSRRWFGRKR